MKASIATLLLAAAACAAPTTEAPSPEPAPVAPAAAPAPAPAPAPAGDLDPVGRYEYTTVVGGQPTTGTFQVSGSPGAYTGRIESTAFPPLQIVRVSTAGRQLTLVAQAPQGEVTVVLDFTGDEFTGRWSLGNEGADMRGRRLP